MIKKVIRKFNKEKQKSIKPAKERIVNIEKELEKLNARISKLFELYENLCIAKEEFIKRKHIFDECIDKYSNERESLLIECDDEDTEDVSYEEVKCVLKNFSRILSENTNV